MTIYMKRKKVIDTNQCAATTTMSYEAELLIEDGTRTEENPSLAKPQPGRSHSLNILETK